MAKAPIRFFLSLIQKRYLQTSSPISQSTKDSSYTVEFLVNSCGLPFESAVSASHKFHIDRKDRENHQSVLDFFTSQGFSQTQIAKLIQRCPRFLKSRVEETFKPKFDFLKENGFSGEFLSELLLKNPAVIDRGLDSRLKPAFNFLKSHLGSNDKVVAAVGRCSLYFSNNLKGVLQPNTDFLKKVGVPADVISKLILCYPRTLLHSSNRMAYGVNAVMNLGLEPSSPMFVHALTVMLQMSESTLKKKMEVFQSLGWTKEDILTTFKKNPCCLALSEENIRRTMDFYVSTMKFNPETIISNPSCLQFSVDLRIRPRYNVLKILESKELIRYEDGKTARWIYLSEENFLKNYVVKYREHVPHLLNLYHSSKKHERSVLFAKE